MCIRVCLRAFVRDTKTEMELLDGKKNLQFKSIEFFHFATHIYVRAAAHIEAYENLYHPVIGIRCRKTLIQKCVLLLVDIVFPRKIVALHQHHHHQHRSPQR